MKGVRAEREENGIKEDTVQKHDTAVDWRLDITIVIFPYHQGVLGQPRWLSGLAPPSAQGLILETQDGVPHQTPCMKPASPSACVSASLCVSLMNK